MNDHRSHKSHCQTKLNSAGNAKNSQDQLASEQNLCLDRPHSKLPIVYNWLYMAHKILQKHALLNLYLVSIPTVMEPEGDQFGTLFKYQL